MQPLLSKLGGDEAQLLPVEKTLNLLHNGHNPQNLFLRPREKWGEESSSWNESRTRTIGRWLSQSDEAEWWRKLTNYLFYVTLILLWSSSPPEAGFTNSVVAIGTHSYIHIYITDLCFSLRRWLLFKLTSVLRHLCLRFRSLAWRCFLPALLFFYMAFPYNDLQRSQWFVNLSSWQNVNRLLMDILKSIQL